jgi:hypothetical protein
LKLQEVVGYENGQHVDGDHLTDPAHPNGSACVINAVEGEHFGFGYDPFACLEEKTNMALEKVFNDVTASDNQAIQDAKEEAKDGLNDLKDVLLPKM